MTDLSQFEKKLKERATKILEGDEPSPNEMITYVRERAVETKEEGKRLLDEIAKAEKHLGALRAKAMQLQGAFQSYSDDIQQLLSKSYPLAVEPSDDV